MINNTIASVNFFGFHPHVIDNIIAKNDIFKQKCRNHKTKECLLPIVINELIKENKIKVKVLKSKDKWYGITNPGDEVIVARQILNDIFYEKILVNKKKI